MKKQGSDIINKMGNVILFDIDGTLFDPNKFGQAIRREFVDILNITEDDLIRANADYYASLESTTDFDPRAITQFIAQRYGVKQSLLDDVFWGEKNIYKECVYPEVPEVLEKLGRENMLGVFSQGGEELQGRKLKACDLEKYFKAEIFIHKRKDTPEAIALLPQGATLIDDSHEIVSKLKNHLKVIWINRRNNDKDTSVQTIHSLTDLLR